MGGGWLRDAYKNKDKEKDSFTKGSRNKIGFFIYESWEEIAAEFCPNGDFPKFANLELKEAITSPTWKTPVLAMKTIKQLKRKIPFVENGRNFCRGNF